MIPPPETFRVNSRRVACDGSGHGIDPALGHPRIYIEIDERGFGECGYCDRRFVLIGGPADGVDPSTLRDISEGSNPI